MKYLSALIVVGMLYWSWNEVHRPPLISAQTHQDIQSDLANIITDVIKEHFPQSEEVQFQRLWTETFSETQIAAFFNYSFRDRDPKDETRTTVQGYAIINKENEKNPDGTDIWALSSVFVDNSNIEFENPLEIHAKSGN